MRFSSSDRKVFSSILLVAFGVTACAPRREARPRVLIPQMAPLSPADQPASPNTPFQLLELDSSVPTSITACDRLASLPAPSSELARFRLISDMTTNEKGPSRIQNSDEDLERIFHEIQMAKMQSSTKIPTDGHSASITSVGNNKGLVDLSRLYGRVDIAANPMYQYALLQGTQPVFDKETFMFEVNKQIKDSPITLPFLIGYELLLRTGVLNVYNERNRIYQNRIDKSFPGIFLDDDSTRVKIRESLPEAIFRNGSPEIAQLTPAPLDSAEAIQKKLQKLNLLGSVYSRPVALFASPKWSDFREDIRINMTVAVRGINSGNSQEQACATVLFHRAMSQMLTIMGFDRPLMQDNPNNNTSRLADFKDWLVDPKGQELRLCPGAGSFVRHEHNITLYREDLENYADTGTANPLLLGKRPFLPSPCTSNEALDYVKGRMSAVEFNPELSDLASGDEQLDFISGISYLLMTFNPGANWWLNSATGPGLPLGYVTSLDTYRTSGAILPFETHVLALGLLNVAFNNFADGHVVIIDSDGHETKSMHEAMGVRVSPEDRKNNKTKIVRTSIRSATLMTDMAIKLGATLEQTARWYANARDAVSEQIKHAPNADERKRIEADFSHFIEGVFGSDRILKKLTTTEPGSLREQLDGLRSAGILLTTRFATRKADGSLGCAAEIINDLEKGTETLAGDCSNVDRGQSKSDRRMWSDSLSLVAASTQSPLYTKMAKEAAKGLK